MNNHCIRIIPPATIARWERERRQERVIEVATRLVFRAVLIGSIMAVTIWLDGGAA